MSFWCGDMELHFFCLEEDAGAVFKEEAAGNFVCTGNDVGGSINVENDAGHYDSKRTNRSLLSK